MFIKSFQDFNKIGINFIKLNFDIFYQTIRLLLILKQKQQIALYIL